MNRLLTAKETAARLRISYATFRNILCNRPDGLPKPILIGSTRRWSEKAVDEWIDRQSRET